MDNMDVVKGILKNLKGCKPIGSGAGRDVYCVGNYIIKKARNKRGKIECENEYWLYNNISLQYKHLSCPVYYFDGKYLIMPKADVVTEEFYNMYIKHKYKGFVEYLVDTYDLDDYDLYCYFNWGMFNNGPVLLDYGHHYFGNLLSDIL